MNRITSFISATITLAVLLFFAGCSKDSDITPLGISNDGKAARIAFTVQTGRTVPVTYTTHDATEYGIHTLIVLRFRPVGNDFVLDERRNLTSLITGQVGPNYRLEWEITNTDNGVYKYLFIANESVDVGVGITLSSLEAKLLERQQTNGKATSLLATDGIPMTGFAHQGTSDLIAVTGTTQCEVPLERTVCRIDVFNRVPSLVISALQMRNVPMRSYLLPPRDATFTIAPGGVVNEPVLPNVSLPTLFDNGKNLLKAFYYFENVMPTTVEAPHIEVTAKLGGTPVFYSIPFAKDGKGIPMKRNHRYVLQLGDGSTVVQPDDWDEVVVNVTFYLIRIKEAQADGALSYSGGFGGTYTLPLNSAEHLSQRFRLQTIFTNHTHYLIETATSGGWLTASISDDRLTVNVSPNTTGAPREGRIRFWSNEYAPPQHTNGVYTLKIVQGN